VSPPETSWVRLLCLISHSTAVDCSSNTVRIRLSFRIRSLGPRSASRSAGSFASNNGSCLLTLKLSFLSQADGPVSGTSRISDFIALPWSPSVRLMPSTWSAQSTGSGSFFTLRLRHRCDVAAFSSIPPDPWIPILAHSNNFRSCGPTVFTHRFLNPEPVNVTRFRSWFLPRASLFHSRYTLLPLTAVLPGRIKHGKERPFPRKPVTCAYHTSIKL